MIQETKKYLIGSLLFIVSLVLIWPAIYNGFPLVYSDSGTYINAGYLKAIPVDRPIIYCLFVRYLSFSQSLWFVIIAQALLVTFVIYSAVKKFTTHNTLLISTLVIFILCLTTGITNFTSQIMPDIFSALTIIGFVIIITTAKMQWKEYLLTFIVIISSITNFSNLILLAGMIVVIFLFMLFRLIKRGVFIRGLIIAAIPFILIISINKALSGKYQISRASNVFIIARMIETGLVKEYLTENCGENDFILCDQIDSLPTTSYEFLWNEKSPLYSGGCVKSTWENCWQDKNYEFGRIIKGILTTPKYNTQLFFTYTKDFFRQLTIFNIPYLDIYADKSAPQGCIEYRFPNELNAYKAAKQYKNGLWSITLTKIQLVFVIISLLVLSLMLFYYRKLKISKEHILILSLLITGLLGNALTVTIFSTVLDRYQSRVIWILPFICLLFVYHYFIGTRRRISEN